MTRLLELSAFFLAALVPLVASGGPWCFQCHNTFHPAGCMEMTQCGNHEYCYTEKHEMNGVTQYSSGCKPSNECRRLVRRVPTVQCSDCCNGTLCNEALCQATVISNGTTHWCAACKAQSSPAGCDRLKLCSPDYLCSITETNMWGLEVYDLDCAHKTVCQGKTLASSNQVCCDQHLCNTNLAAQSPDIYTTPAPTTTTPPPSLATAVINETVMNYVSHNDPNENLTLICHVGGYPEPNVTWYFVPDDVNATSAYVNDMTSTATPPGNFLQSTGTNTMWSTASSNVGNGSASIVNTTMTSAMLDNTTAANHQRTEVTKGVTTMNGISTLVIIGPNETVAGQYVCHAENAKGSVEANVTVTYAAAPLIHGTDNGTVNAQVREDVLLDCEVEGKPQPAVHWMKPANAGGTEQLANGSLLLHNVHGDSSGYYQCQASNSVGNSSKSFQVYVDDNSTAPCSTQLTTLMTTAFASTQQSSTPVASATPLVCPTLSSTTTAQATPTTSTPTTTTINPITTSTATPQISATLATTMTTSDTATTVTMMQTSPTTPPQPSISAVGSLWRNSESDMAVLQCNAHARPGMTSVPPITWSRLEENYDHSDTKTYTENGHGVLVITPHGQSPDASGVYQCHVFGGSDNDTAEFAVYKSIPGPIDCRLTFDVGHPSPGVVFRTTCGPCQPAPIMNSHLIWRDKICQSAVGRGLIQQTGGTVSWVIRQNNLVALLKEEDGHLKLVT